MRGGADVGGHDYVVRAIKEEFAKEFDGLTFGYVIGAGEEDRVVVSGEEEVVVGGEVLRDQGFMFGQDLLRNALAR
jgi:hypothetical protein